MACAWTWTSSAHGHGHPVHMHMGPRSQVQPDLLGEAACLPAGQRVHSLPHLSIEHGHGLDPRCLCVGHVPARGGVQWCVGGNKGRRGVQACKGVQGRARACKGVQGRATVSNGAQGCAAAALRKGHAPSDDLSPWEVWVGRRAAQPPVSIRQPPGAMEGRATDHAAAQRATAQREALLRLRERAHLARQTGRRVGTGGRADRQ